jgi:hypothetical protein
LPDNCSTIIAFSEKVSKNIPEIVAPMGLLRVASGYFVFIDLLPLETELNLFNFMPKKLPEQQTRHKKCDFLTK